MATVPVNGKATFQGDQVVLTLTPGQAQQMPPKKKAAKEPQIVRAMPLPDPRALVHDINAGRTQCHATRLPITVPHMQVMIRNIRSQMNLCDGGISWSVNANDRLYELLLKPKQKRGKIAAILNDEGEANSPSQAANMLENNIPQNDLKEMEPIVAEVPSSVYAKDNTKDNVNKYEVEKEDVNKHGAIKEHEDPTNTDQVDIVKDGVEKNYVNKDSSAREDGAPAENAVNPADSPDGPADTPPSGIASSSDSSTSSSRSSTSSTSSSSTPKEELRRKIIGLEADLEEVSQDLYLANDALGCHDFR